MDTPIPPAPPPAPPLRGSSGPRLESTVRRWTRRIPWIGGALLVTLIVVGLWPQPLPVEVGAVTRGPLRVTVDEEGRTRVRNRYVIAAPVSGALRRIEWKAGAPVEAGKTLLATLETSGADLLDARSLAQAEARVHAAESTRSMAAARRESAAASLTFAQADMGRVRDLFAKGALSRQEFEDMTMRATTAAQDDRAAMFALQVADYELEQARALLMRGQPDGGGGTATLEIRTPVNGRVLRVFQESARVVPSGMALLEVGDQTDLEVLVEVLSRDGVAIRPGARVWLERWGGDHPLEARVRLVEPSAFTKFSALGVEEQRVNVIADFVDPVEKRPTLGDAYRVEARIVTWEGENVLQAPAGALFQRAGQWQTFGIDGRHARLRNVEIGRTNGIATEIRGGLREGEKIVVYPGDKVVDGGRVKAE
jgi:HlyD family secretion protein